VEVETTRGNSTRSRRKSEQNAALLMLDEIKKSRARKERMKKEEAQNDVQMAQH
jgi:hypothetical protein